MAKLTAEIKSFTDADVFLGSKRTRKLGNNTYVESPDYADDVIGVRLHATVIVTYHRDGRIILNTGGWNTPTTRDRLSSLVPEGVSVSGSKDDRSGRAEDLNVTKYHYEYSGRGAGGVLSDYPNVRVETIRVIADRFVVITTDPETGEVLDIEGDRK